MAKYVVTLNGKNYEVEVEKNTAKITNTTAAAAPAAAPAPKAAPAPAPVAAPAPAPESPVLPAVQDAKLIQTGTSGWLADLMLGAGMVLSAAGYWMERKRKAMFYKSQH